MEKSILITGIVCIAALEGIALFKGINGTALAATIAVIAGLCGYGVKSVILKKRK